MLAVLGQLDGAAYRRAVHREVPLATLILLVFALLGHRILGVLDIQPWSLTVAGGVILFLISLKMIFKTSAAIFDNGYRDDPLLVPVATPAIAGPSAITTVLVLRTQGQASLAAILLALALVSALTWGILLLGPPISRRLGLRGLAALEKLMGLLLNLLAVDMLLGGVRDFLGGQ